MMGGFGQMNSNGSMGVPPPTPNSNGMGAAPAMQQQLTNQPSQNNVMAGALVPSTQQSNPYALGGAADAAAAFRPAADAASLHWISSISSLTILESSASF